jgi:hypothetical protein
VRVAGGVALGAGWRLPGGCDEMLGHDGSDSAKKAVLFRSIGNGRTCVNLRSRRRVSSFRHLRDETVCQG